ncbi:MAG: hypothetical protein AAFO07_30935 [Bacteroidota bacterium]
MIGLLSIIAIYYVGNVQASFQQDKFSESIKKFAFRFPMFLAMSMGLSLHNSIAVMEGYRGKKSPFVRTPKLNIKTGKDKLYKNKYLARKITWSTYIEGFLALYFLIGGVFGALYVQNTTFIVYHLMLALGFGTVFYYSVKHSSL